MGQEIFQVAMQAGGEQGMAAGHVIGRCGAAVTWLQKRFCWRQAVL
jgi:hypothetical protein